MSQPSIYCSGIVLRVWDLKGFFFQEGKIRGKLAKLLKDKDGVRFEDSLATGDGIKIVSILCHSYPSLFSDMELNGLALHHTSSF